VGGGSIRFSTSPWFLAQRCQMAIVLSRERHNPRGAMPFPGNLDGLTRAPEWNDGIRGN
jgi:hypothetical protein